MTTLICGMLIVFLTLLAIAALRNDPKKLDEHEPVKDWQTRLFTHPDE